MSNTGFRSLSVISYVIVSPASRCFTKDGKLLLCGSAKQPIGSFGQLLLLGRPSTALHITPQYSHHCCHITDRYPERVCCPHPGFIFLRPSNIDSENSIDAGSTTEFAFMNSLFVQAANTTMPAVAVEGSMYGAVVSSAEITLLATQFLPAQVAYAIQYGYNPQVFACQQLGLVFAFGNGNGSTSFANNVGPSNAAFPNTPTGDAAFAATAASILFGSADTVILQDAISGYVTFLKGFFTANGIAGVQNPTANEIDLAARAGAWGDGVAIALGNILGPVAGQTIDFLDDAAQGTAIYSASFASQPTPALFQGQPTTSATASHVQVVGVAAPVDHAV